MATMIDRTYEKELQGQITRLLDRFPQEPVYSRNLSNTIEKIEEFVTRAFYNQYPLDDRRIERSIVMMTNPPILDRLMMILYRILGVYRTEKEDLEALQELLSKKLQRTPARPPEKEEENPVSDSLITAQFAGRSIYELKLRC